MTDITTKRSGEDVSIDPYELERIKDILKELGYIEYPLIIPDVVD